MNVTKTLVAYLKENLDCRVSTEMPEHRVLPYVTVARAGGSGNRFREEAVFEIHAWGNTESEAIDLSHRIDDIIYDLDGYEDNVISVYQESWYSNLYVDGTRRWTAVYDIITNR